MKPWDEDFLAQSAVGIMAGGSSSTVRRAYAPSLKVKADEEIEGGTSGGPIIDDSGDLVGIVSVMSLGNEVDGCEGSAPRPHLALPVWVCRLIFGREDEALLGGRSVRDRG